MWPTRAARQQLEDGVEHAEPGAQHRHDDDVGARRGGRRPGPSGVSTVALRVAQVAQRLGGQQQR